MCGIAGILTTGGEPECVLPNLLAMTAAMRRRGPDDEGYFWVNGSGASLYGYGDETPSNVRNAHRNLKPITDALGQKSILALGHRRLSIVDLTAGGHQPMSDLSGRYTLTFNGEIYNFRDVREDLEALGHRFSSDSDTEVVVSAYAEWGPDCLQHFNGDFAFAIWDRDEQSLFCARDRLGVKPFYYVNTPSRFLFGSDIKTIIASGLYDPKPSPDGVYLSMAFGIAPRPLTAFEGVVALEQGHWIKVGRSGDIRRHRYWDIPIGQQDHSMTLSDAVDGVENQLREAVKRRLSADVPVGTFMSGGIDSTTMSALAAQLVPGVQAFTLGYKEAMAGMDEVPQAAATAAMYDMRHMINRINPSEAVTLIDDWIAGYEEPYYHVAVTSVMADAVSRSGVKVVLSGLGGDELFGGYNHFRWCKQIPTSPLLAPLYPLADRIKNRTLRKGLCYLTAGTNDRAGTCARMANSDALLKGLFETDWHLNISTPDYLNEAYAQSREFEDTVEAISYMELMNYIGNHHLHRTDQFTMWHSIEGRVPYLDHELVEFAARVPSRFKVYKGTGKYVLRQVAEKHIAPECLSQPKKGFGLPLAEWMRGPLRPLVDNSLERLRKRPMIRSAMVDKMIAMRANNTITGSQIWHLVALELWFAKFIDG